MTKRHRQRHVLAVYRMTAAGLGGIGAHRNVPRYWTIDEIVQTWGSDPRTIRLQFVEVAGDEVTILHDRTYHDRIAAVGTTEGIADEVRRAARLDDHGDGTVHDVLFGDTCLHWHPCPHRKARRAVR